MVALQRQDGIKKAIIMPEVCTQGWAELRTSCVRFQDKRVSGCVCVLKERV